MDNEDTKFTHIGVTKTTHRKAAILAKVLDNTNIYSLVEFWANSAWDSAIEAGLVTNAMLNQGKQSAHVIGKPFTATKKSGSKATV
jgi:hypothetical protein